MFATAASRRSLDGSTPLARARTAPRAVAMSSRGATHEKATEEGGERNETEGTAAQKGLSGRAQRACTIAACCSGSGQRTPRADPHPRGAPRAPHVHGPPENNMNTGGCMLPGSLVGDHMIHSLCEQGIVSVGLMRCR
eukprot:3212060-Prymnesium_polylepis.1